MKTILQELELKNYTKMKITTTTHKTDKGNQIVLALIGRLDTATSAQTMSYINVELERQGDISSLTIDASELEYISSSGLRILLGLTKRYKDFRIVEVSSDVYNVLNMTGFTKIMNVEKALRRMSVDGCEIIGRGGVGIVYRLDDDTIIKVFREGTTIAEVRTEITMSKEAFVLGMPTAISFDIVRVGSQYGLVYELLRAETLSTCIKRNPEKIDTYARKYAALFRQLHCIEVPVNSNIPSAIAHEEQSVRHIRRYFDEESIGMMMNIIHAIPNANRLLHLDLQTKNAMVQDSELMLIDMGEVGYGHPILDLGHAYSAMVSLVGDYDAIIGMPRELGTQLWERMIGYYFEGESPETLAHRKAQIEVAACVRNFSWLSLSDSFPEEVVNECRQLFAERIGNRQEYIRNICQTFSDWELPRP